MNQLIQTTCFGPGQSDKAADQISDLIVDFFLERDVNAQVDVSTMLSDKLLIIGGQFLTDPSILEEAKMVLPYRIKDLLSELYPDRFQSFLWNEARKIFEIKNISDHINLFNKSHQNQPLESITAYGYACDDTETFLPLSIDLSTQLIARHYDLFKTGNFPIGSDSKCTLIVEYEGIVPKKIKQVFFTTQHLPNIDTNKLADFIIQQIIEYIIPKHLRDKNITYKINMLGDFIKGGPQSHIGHNGKKAYSDAYGPQFGYNYSLSGKDPHKIQRCSFHIARAIAKSIVSAGIARRAHVYLNYTTIQQQPTSIHIELVAPLTSVNNLSLASFIQDNIDLSIEGIIFNLSLNKPIFQKISLFGPFCKHHSDFLWETEYCDQLTKLLEQQFAI